MISTVMDIVFSVVAPFQDASLPVNVIMGSLHGSSLCRS